MPNSYFGTAEQTATQNIFSHHWTPTLKFSGLKAQNTKDKDIQLQFKIAGKGCLGFYWDETITEIEVGKAFYSVKITFCLKKFGLPFDFVQLCIFHFRRGWRQLFSPRTALLKPYNSSENSILFFL